MFIHHLQEIIRGPRDPCDSREGFWASFLQFLTKPLPKLAEVIAPGIPLADPQITNNLVGTWLQRDPPAKTCHWTVTTGSFSPSNRTLRIQLREFLRHEVNRLAKDLVRVGDRNAGTINKDCIP